ncbi:hypothetical protein LZ575_03075 [Antarcticibacterium sp. 1MA-6-2]|uniref:hypothetical protein n=1 Tax=Antarcticibacterium sp. 1MA-6-2 TaxID=2908210 RepID=UPI001F16CE25|nr:hypothetical protein [Antarcticibacterium sp. 1MA-6-2]UJH91685.1 hypothetical protein LZ575_03075 [Antarcticibacterium sp. 1MA-6-2]
MDPYLQIAKDHVPTDDLLRIVSARECIDFEDLKRLIAETRKRPEPKRMTKDQEQRAEFRKRLQRLI